MAKYKGSKDFRVKIISLLVNPLWLARFGFDIIKPEYFDGDDEKAVVTAMLEFYRLYRRAPTDPDDVVVMCDGKYEDLIHDVFYGGYDIDVASDVVIRFAKEQAAKIAILDSIPDVESGDLEKVVGRITEASRVGQSLAIPGMDVIRDSDKWLYDVWSSKIRTGLVDIDKVLDGGLSIGELGLVMAPTNRGKSMALVNIGFGAAGLGSGMDVIHITHEMSDKVVSKRYAARLTFRFPNRNDNLIAYDDELHRVARRLMPGNVRVLDLGRCKFDDIKRSIDITLSQGTLNRLGLIIDDYPDLIVPGRYYKERRHELTQIYEQLRHLGREYGVPVWGATHSNRGSYNKEVITLADVSEDLGKCRTADVVMALCQTKEEEDAEQCRLFMAKVRDGDNHAMIKAKYYKHSQAIVTTGMARKRDSDNEGH